MHKKIQKLQSYLNEYLGKTEEEIINELGDPIENYLEDALIYVKPYKIFFRDEIVFLIEKGKVTDIAITECFLSIGLRNIISSKEEDSGYEIVELF